MAVYPTKSCDRVWETDTVTGTGTISLGSTAASGGYRTFDAAYTAGQLASGNLVRYGIRDTTTYAWEIGLGTYTNGSPSTLSRTIVFQSSNSNALVSFAGNSCDVWIDANASKIDQGMPPFVAGRWYGCDNVYLAESFPAAAGFNWITALPLQWRGPATPSALGIYCSTAPSAAITLYLGIYDGTDGSPGSLLTSGSLSLSATGLNTVSLSSPPVIDVPEVFLALGSPSSSNSAQIFCTPPFSIATSPAFMTRSMGTIGCDPTISSINALGGMTGYSSSYAGGALPSTWPSGTQYNIALGYVGVQF